jgi:hypothetical protein
MHKMNKRSFVMNSAAALCGLATVTALAQTKEKPLRIGIYDSRSIVIAFVHSDLGRKSKQPFMIEYEKAKADKNDQRLKEIKDQMSLLQRRQHKQGFSTDSVIGIMEKVKASLPAIA